MFGMFEVLEYCAETMSVYDMILCGFWVFILLGIFVCGSR